MYHLRNLYGAEKLPLENVENFTFVVVETSVLLESDEQGQKRKEGVLEVRCQKCQQPMAGIKFCFHFVQSCHAPILKSEQPPGQLF
jgi:hypothetical protein